MLKTLFSPFDRLRTNGPGLEVIEIEGELVEA